MENLPQSEEFVCYSKLGFDEIFKRLKSVTITKGGFVKTKEYLGEIKNGSFKISNYNPRKIYGTVLPMRPWLKFIPKFIEGNIQEDGKSSKITINFKIHDATKAGNYSALFIFLFPFFIAVAVIIAFWSLGMFNNINSAPNPSRNEGLTQLFRLFGMFTFGAIAIIIKNFFDVKKYKENYPRIVDIEKKNLLKLFEAETSEEGKL